MDNNIFKKAFFGFYRLPYEIFLCLATWVTPKKDNHILFAPFYNDTVNGNLWPLYHYINKYHTEIKTLIAVNDRSSYLKLKNQGEQVILSGSIKALFAAARASYLVVDHNTGTIFFWGILQGLSKIKVIQVWHGTGFKQIVLLDEKTKPRGLIQAIRHFDNTIRCKNYNCIISSSKEDKIRKEQSFFNKNVCITGYPKNDILFEKNSVASSNSAYIEGQYRKIFLYAPTYRDAGSFQPFSNNFWDLLETEMISCDGLFLIKRHPKNEDLNVPKGFSRIRDITEIVPNIQLLFLEVDMLITDYSSIAVDYVLTGKPVVYYIFDYESYIKDCRSFYYNLQETLPGPFVYNQDTLLKYMLNKKWFYEQEYQNRYFAFRDRFNYYQDSGSCRRVVETCMQEHR